MKLLPAMRKIVLNLIKFPQKMLFSFPFMLVYGVYFATFSTANCLDVYNERTKASANIASMTKLFGTTAVNMSASLVRDGLFAKMFG